MRDSVSPKRAASHLPDKSNEPTNPMSPAMQLSARATARPPSEQSWAERTILSATARRHTLLDGGFEVQVDAWPAYDLVVDDLEVLAPGKGGRFASHLVRAKENDDIALVPKGHGRVGGHVVQQAERSYYRSRVDVASARLVVEAHVAADDGRS